MVAKYLDLCTSHLCEETINKLNSETTPFSYPYEEGVFISVPESEDLVGKIPSDLKRLLGYCWENNIQLVRLDRDSEEIEDLPTYDWFN